MIFIDELTYKGDLFDKIIEFSKQYSRPRDFNALGPRKKNTINAAPIACLMHYKAVFYFDAIPHGFTWYSYIFTWNPLPSESFVDLFKSTKSKQK